MISGLPIYISLVFILTTLLSVSLFYKATRSAAALWVVLIWLTLQGAIGFTGFYANNETIPPRISLLLLLPLLTITWFFVSKRGRALIDGFDVKWLTILHIVRVPVETVLFWLFLQKQVPQLMTFEGRNFDIFSGITAPFVAYFGYVKPKLPRGILITWNLICLGLLFNIVINAILSVPSPFQQQAFDQPNVGVLYFPFVWLPCAIVPMILLGHLVALRRALV